MGDVDGENREGGEERPMDTQPDMMAHEASRPPQHEDSFSEQSNYGGGLPAKTESQPAADGKNSLSARTFGLSVCPFDASHLSLHS